MKLTKTTALELSSAEKETLFNAFSIVRNIYENMDHDEVITDRNEKTYFENGIGWLMESLDFLSTDGDLFVEYRADK